MNQCTNIIVSVKNKCCIILLTEAFMYTFDFLSGSQKVYFGVGIATLLAGISYMFLIRKVKFGTRNISNMILSPNRSSKYKQFAFLPYNELKGISNVIVDGRGNGSTVLELSHWKGIKSVFLFRISLRNLNPKISKRRSICTSGI